MINREEILNAFIVLSELCGLSQPPSSSNNVTMACLLDNENVDWVGERAKQAVKYLHEVADKKSPQFCTVTSKGSRLPTLIFAAEDTSRSLAENVSN